MAKLIGTPKELEQVTGLNQVILSTLLRMAEKNGAAKIIKTIKSTSGKGKPSNVWEVESEFTIKLG
jgi:predicted transcriptional regulator